MLHLIRIPAATAVAMRPSSVLPTVTLLLLAALLAGRPAAAQEVRYSWMDLSYMAQDIGRSASRMPTPSSCRA